MSPRSRFSTAADDLTPADEAHAKIAAWLQEPLLAACDDFRQRRVMRAALIYCHCRRRVPRGDAAELRHALSRDARY